MNVNPRWIKRRQNQGKMKSRQPRPRRNWQPTVLHSWWTKNDKNDGWFDSHDEVWLWWHSVGWSFNAKNLGLKIGPLYIYIFFFFLFKVNFENIIMLIVVYLEFSTMGDWNQSPILHFQSRFRFPLLFCEVNWFWFLNLRNKHTSVPINHQRNDE